MKRFALAVISLAASACDAGERVAVAINSNSMLVPTQIGAKKTEFRKVALPFFYREQAISPIGPTIRLVGAPSNSASESTAAIWELPDNGVWTESRPLPIGARAVFVSDQTWGYIDRESPRNIVVFEHGSESPLKVALPTGFAVDDRVPVVWIDGERAVILSLAKSGLWASNSQGISVNTTPPGEWTISKMSINSGKITPITLGERPTLSPDQKTLAFLRGGEMWVRYVDTGRERVAQKPHPLGNGVQSLFWLDSNRLIFNTPTGSELFGQGSRCTELDLVSGKVQDLWIGDTGCSVALVPSYGAG